MSLLQVTQRGDVLFTLGVVQHIAGPMAVPVSQAREKLHMPLIQCNDKQAVYHVLVPPKPEDALMPTIKFALPFFKGGHVAFTQ